MTTKPRLGEGDRAIDYAAGYACWVLIFGLVLGLPIALLVWANSALPG